MMSVLWYQRNVSCTDPFKIYFYLRSLSYNTFASANPEHTIIIDVANTRKIFSQNNAHLKQCNLSNIYLSYFFLQRRSSLRQFQM